MRKAIIYVALLIGTCQISNALSATNSTRGIRAPAFFPDGHAVVFSVLLGAKEGIYRLALDGSREQQLITTGKENSFPVILPSGDGIIYTSLSADAGRPTLYRAELNGNNRQKVLADAEYVGFAPAVSTDGTEIAFLGKSKLGQRSERIVGVDVFLASIDGRNIRQLTNYDCFSISRPSINPKSGTILFQKSCDPESWDWEIVNPESRSRKIINTDARILPTGERLVCRQTCTKPTFSADGQEIIFVQYRNTGDVLYALNPELREVRLLFSSPGIFIADFAVDKTGQQFLLTVTKHAGHRGFGMELWLVSAGESTVKVLYTIQ